MIQSKNPFIPSSEINSDDDFFDRDKFVSKIQQFIETNQATTLFLVGPRRIGKTSLLKKLLRLYSSKPVVGLYYNFQGKESWQLFEILDYLATKFEPAHFRKINQKQVFWELLQRYFQRVEPTEKLVLLFDEFDEFARSEAPSSGFPDFVEELMHLAEKNNWPLKIICSVGRNNYKQFIKKKWNTDQLYQVLELDMFSAEVVDKLLSKSETAQLPFTPNAKTKLFSYTRGHPYFTQCLAFSAYSIAESERKTSIDEQGVEKALIPAVTRYGAGLVWMWTSFKPMQHLLLWAAAQFCEKNKAFSARHIRDFLKPFSMNVLLDQLQLDIQLLANEGIFCPVSQNTFCFQMEYFRKWIKVNITQENVLNGLKSF